MHPLVKNKITIHTIKIIEEIPNYWSDQDYINLLEKFDFPDAKSVKPENLFGMLQIAISDFEPNAAAAIVLEYKLSDRLNEGQIDQISNDMLLDKISEEYPEIDLHCDLFSINQLLFKAYNGKFPNTKAISVNFTIQPEEPTEITAEIILKSFNKGLSDRNLVKRLYANEMETGKRFADAASILWQLLEIKTNEYQLITSEYWINKEDLISDNFEGSFALDEEELDDQV